MAMITCVRLPVSVRRYKKHKITHRTVSLVNKFCNTSAITLLLHTHQYKYIRLHFLSKVCFKI